MTNTSHGHHILGTTIEAQQAGKSVGRCGGPVLCGVCACEAQMLLSSRGISFALNYPALHIKENTQMETKSSSKLDVKKFMRRTFDVEAVQVTEENFEDVAEWCGGRIVTVKPSQNEIPELGLPLEQRHISVEVSRPLSRRQTEAYVGDWVLYASKGFKVYTNRPFQKNFTERTDQLQELFVTSDKVGVTSEGSTS